MNTLKPVRLSHLKTQAAFLLKEFRQGGEHSAKAVQRFLQLSSFTRQQLLDHPEAVKLKHAYHVIGFENGFPDWNTLRQTVIESDCLYRPCCVAYIHSWFTTYEQASLYYKQHGGYLLTFWNDYIVCGKEYIKCIGLDDYTDQWQKISYNWVHPADRNAWIFLSAHAAKLYLNQS
jgi:hypothetical protein